MEDEYQEAEKKNIEITKKYKNDLEEIFKDVKYTKLYNNLSIWSDNASNNEKELVVASTELIRFLNCLDEPLDNPYTNPLLKVEYREKMMGDLLDSIKKSFEKINWKDTKNL